MSPDGINRSTVVCVDDDDLVLDLLETALPRFGTFEVEGFTDAGAALSRIREGGVDCVVSDYEMPEFDGFALLEQVRALDPDVPFILYTGRGSEEIASDALSRGVTDYLRKESGIAQFALLGWRIEEAISKYLAERETDRRLRAMETDREGICIVGEDGTFEYADGAYLDLYGYREDDLIDAEWRLLQPASVVERTLTEALPVAREEGQWSGESVGRRADGSTFRELRSVTSLPDGGLVVVVDLDDPPWGDAE
ncbi:response regulator [Salinirubellus sp. GCM10025818]|uniref:response regulator n=1 Tax=Salinirubellus TaxID=2162630 RepID=UPI0030CE5C3C